MEEAYLDGCCNAVKFGLDIQGGVCCQCSRGAALLEVQQLVLQQGEHDGEEELHLVLMILCTLELGSLHKCIWLKSQQGHFNRQTEDAPCAGDPPHSCIGQPAQSNLV